MAKPRPRIPKAIGEQVLKEYRHLCSICGRPQPQLHHLDENPANNDPLNLLPLCPNCHLQDTHDPTSPPHQQKLALFRKLKDPLILDPRFHPIFRRTLFLRDSNLRTEKPKRYIHLANELLDIVAELRMGAFYRKKVLEMLHDPVARYARHLTQTEGKEYSTHEVRIIPDLAEEAYEHSAGEIEFLIVELLRFQDWHSPLKRYHKPEADE